MDYNENIRTSNNRLFTFHSVIGKKTAFIPILQRHKAPGSIVVSGEWISYDELNSMGVHSFNSMSQTKLCKSGEPKCTRIDNRELVDMSQK
ncbi:hypothetical protein HZS_3265 [Henneguya salminicola]|nr:hypothetical protein HZS_3265 [Henneguya salminicola]